MKDSGEKAFTVIELLTVTAIISIIAGMIVSSTSIARSRAYKAAAATEVQQIAMAVKSLWLSSTESNDPRLSPFTGASSSGVELTESVLTSSGLISTGKDPSFLEIPPDRIEDGAYRDPWGNPYRVRMDKPEDFEEVEVFQVAVSFPNEQRYYLQEEGTEQ